MPCALSPHCIGLSETTDHHSSCELNVVINTNEKIRWEEKICPRPTGMARNDRIFFAFYTWKWELIFCREYFKCDHLIVVLCFMSPLHEKCDVNSMQFSTRNRQRIQKNHLICFDSSFIFVGAFQSPSLRYFISFHLPYNIFCARVSQYDHTFELFSFTASAIILQINIGIQRN